MYTWKSASYYSRDYRGAWKTSGAICQLQTSSNSKPAPRTKVPGPHEGGSPGALTKGKFKASIGRKETGVSWTFWLGTHNGSLSKMLLSSADLARMAKNILIDKHKSI